MELQKRNNFICYGLLIAALIIVHYVIELWPDVKMLQSQKVLFSWRAIGIIGLLGLESVYVLNLTGLKKLWNADIGVKYIFHSEVWVDGKIEMMNMSYLLRE